MTNSPQSLVWRPFFGWMLIAVLCGAFLSAFFSLQWGAFALAFALVAWWAWQKPEQGFLLFVVLAPILPMLKITQTIGTVTLIKDVLIITLFLRLVGVPLLTKTLPYRRMELLLPIALLGVWTLVELVRADALVLGVLRARDIGLYALLYFIVLYLPWNARIARERLAWFTATVIGVLGLGVYQWLAAADSAVLRFDPVREIWIPRLSSVMAHPSIFGEYLVIAAALCGALVLFTKKRLVQAGFAVLGVAATASIYYTFSRAVWIGLAAAGAVMLMVWLWSRFGPALLSRYKRYLVVGLVFLLLALYGVVAFTPAGVFVRSVFDPTYASNEERLEFLARLVAPMTNTEALFGKGLGDVLTQNFREVDVDAFDIASGASREVQLTKNRTLVDNQHLKTFVEMGLAGLLIYGWLYWLVFRSGVRSVLAASSRTQSLVGLWVVGVVTAFVIQGFFIDIWDIFPTNAYFWIAVGQIALVVQGQKI